jgi:hypothetical protein
MRRRRGCDVNITKWNVGVEVIREFGGKKKSVKPELKPRKKIGLLGGGGIWNLINKIGDVLDEERFG